MSSLIHSPLFGILLTLFAFEIGMLFYKKTKLPIFNPLLIAVALIIGFLLLFHIDYTTYNYGGNFINAFLGPATVILAVPLYKQFALLKKYLLPIIVGILVGCFSAISCSIILGNLVGLDTHLIASLVPKSVTTPIGVEVASAIGGIPSITIVCIIITGIVGAIVAPFLCKVFRIKDEVAIGIAIGTSAHALGTSKALEMGETHGAMSSLSIGIAGLMTVFLAPPIYILACKILKIC